MKRCIYIAILVMGVSGLVAEILLLRELLIVYAGNELSIGIVLANWLLLEALGCFFPGRLIERLKRKVEAFAVISVLFSVALIVAVVMTRRLKGLIGVSIGEGIGLFPIVYTSFLILLPVSMLHGALFTFTCHLYAAASGQDAATAGTVYAYETVGAITGGVACTYLIVPYFSTLQAVTGVALLNLIVAAVLLAPAWGAGRLQKALLGALAALTVVAGYGLVAGPVDRLHAASIKAQWKHQNVVHYQNSPFGNISVVENEGQFIYFLDGVPTLITPIPDRDAVEEFVHLPMLAHPHPTEILILSGGAGGILSEALKHPSIERIEYAELDPLLLSLLREFSTPLTEAELLDDRVQIKHVDGRLLLRTTPRTYDLIFVGITEPSNLQANRFFTREFFTLAQSRLKAGGILVLGVPGSLTLRDDALRDLNGCIYTTLTGVFPHTRVIPGEGAHLFLASDAAQVLAVDRDQVVARLDERGITSNVGLPWTIESKLHAGWQDWFSQLLEGSSTQTNLDFRPLGLFFSISYWNALYAPRFGALYRQAERLSLGTLFLAFALFAMIYAMLYARRTARRKPPAVTTRAAGAPARILLSVVTTGFAGMLFSLVVIFAFQSVYGYVFSWIGLLTASFMAGAACGALLITRALPRLANGLAVFVTSELAILGVALGLPIILSAAHTFADSPGAYAALRLLFLSLPFACGLVTGSQFPLANQLYLQSDARLSSTAGRLYASDLLGGWLGGIVGGVVLLPVLGLVGTGITVGLLKLTSLSVWMSQTHAMEEVDYEKSTP